MKSIIKGYHIGLIAAILVVLIISPLAKPSWAGWSHYDPNNTSAFLPSSRINDLVMDPNRLWIGTDQGLVEYDLCLDDPNTGWTIHLDYDPNYSPVASMNIDQDNLIWLGTPYGLVSYEPDTMDPNIYPGLQFSDTNVIDPYQIVDITADPNFVWVATDQGLNQFDRLSESWNLFSNDPNGFDSFSARAVVSSEYGTIWVLPTLTGVYRYILSVDQWDQFNDVGVIFDSQLMGDSNDIWFGSGSGLFRLHLSDPNTWDQWQEAEYGLPSNSVKAIAMYRGSHQIIVATSGGIARYDLGLDLWQPIAAPDSLDLEAETITEIIVDPNRHQVWFGTEGSGIYRWIEGAIIWSDPVNEAEDVSLDTNAIQVVFNHRIDPDTVELGRASSSLTLTLSDANNPDIDFDPNDFTWYFRDANTNTHLIIEPPGDLYPDTSYTFKFTSDILDHTGESIPSLDRQIEFKTIEPPRVVDTDPDPNTVDVNPYAQFSVWFNKAMDPNSFFPNMITFQPPAPAFPQNISSGEVVFTDPNLLVITVSGGLQPGTAYTFSINKAVTDLSGNPMLAAYQFDFTTKSAPQIVFQSFSPFSPWPEADANDVSLDTNIAVTFSRAMDTNSVEAHFTIDPNISGTFSWLSGNTRVVFQPDTPLESNTEYEVTIDANARDLDGIPLGVSQTWSFTTVLVPIFPTVVSVFPTEGETAASIYTNVSVTFSLEMDTNSVEDAFELTDANTNDISGTFQWSVDSKRFDFDPNDLLDPNMTYTASIADSAHSGGLFLDSNKTWQFTTVMPATMSEPSGGWPVLDIMGMDPNSTAITAMAVDPLNGELWVGIADANSYAGQGLFHFDGGTWTQYSSSDPNCGLTSDAINDIAFDSQGNLWVATEPDPNGGGVHMFDGQDWYSYSPDSDPNQFFIQNRASLSGPEIQDFFSVNAIEVYDTGTEDLILIATTGGMGIGRYDSGITDWKWSASAEKRLLYMLAADPVTRTIWFESGNPVWDESEPCDAIAGIDADLLIADLDQWPDIWDPNNMAWSPNGGIPKMRFLGTFRPFLRAMAADASHNLWLATIDGLYKISIDSLFLGSCDYEVYDPSETGGGLLSDNILGLTLNPDDPNELWVNTDSGISVYQLTGAIGSPASWTRYPLTGIQVFSMLPLPDGGIQTGTDRGMFITGDAAHPSVIDSYPADSATDVSVGADYWVTFSELMDPDATEAAFSFTDAGSASVSGTLSWEGRTLKFEPDSELDPNAHYSMSVGTGATDLAGNSIDPNFRVDFVTSGHWIGSTSPVNGAVDVSISGLVITVDFIKSMNSTTTEAAFCLKVDPNAASGPCIDGNFVWPSADQLQFTLGETLEEGTVYVLSIDTNATDVSSNPMPDGFTMQFTTETITPVHWIQPIGGTNPEDGATNVNFMNLTITLNFIKSMDPNTTESAFCLRVVTDSNTPEPCVDGNFVWPTLQNNKVLQFTPHDRLAAGNVYILTINGTDSGSAYVATDPNAVEMPVTFEMQFTTASISRVLTFTGIGCFVRSIEYERRGTLDRIKDWLGVGLKNKKGLEP
ncbi:MAG: Ig-like domain-containing protein [bacterium]